MVLEHTEPAGGVHWDLLVARNTDPAAALWGLRCQQRPDGKPNLATQVEPMPDHHPAWLEREGQVSGGRGVVRRVARGLLAVRGEVAQTQWDDGRRSWWRLCIDDSAGSGSRPGPTTFLNAFGFISRGGV